MEAINKYINVCSISTLAIDNTFVSASVRAKLIVLYKYVHVRMAAVLVDGINRCGADSRQNSS